MSTGSAGAPCLADSGRAAKRKRSIEVHCFRARLSEPGAVELLANDSQFIAREGAAIFVLGAEAAVIDQLFAPDIRTDHREVAPTHADVAGERPLQRPQSALSRRGRPLGIHDHGPFLWRQQPIAFRRDRRRQVRLDQSTDLLAPEIVPRDIGRECDDQLVASPDFA